MTSNIPSPTSVGAMMSSLNRSPTPMPRSPSPELPLPPINRQSQQETPISYLTISPTMNKTITIPIFSPNHKVSPSDNHVGRHIFRYCRWNTRHYPDQPAKCYTYEGIAKRETKEEDDKRLQKLKILFALKIKSLQNSEHVREREPRQERKNKRCECEHCAEIQQVRERTDWVRDVNGEVKTFSQDDLLDLLVILSNSEEKDKQAMREEFVGEIVELYELLELDRYANLDESGRWRWIGYYTGRALVDRDAVQDRDWFKKARDPNEREWRAWLDLLEKGDYSNMVIYSRADS